MVSFVMCIGASCTLVLGCYAGVGAGPSPQPVEVTTSDDYVYEQAPPQIETQPVRDLSQRRGGTSLDAFPAAGRTLRLIEYGEPSKPLGPRGRRGVRIRRSAIPLQQSFVQDLEHRFFDPRVRPADARTDRR